MMKRRNDNIVLKAMRNTFVAACTVAVLFAGMLYSLWTLLDSNRIMSTVTVTGRVVPLHEGWHDELASGTATDLQVRLFFFNGDELSGMLKQHDTMLLALSGTQKNSAVPARILEVSDSPQLQHDNARAVLLVLHDIGHNQLHDVSRLVAQSTYARIDLQVRTKKLWQAALDKMAL